MNNKTIKLTTTQNSYLEKLHQSHWTSEKIHFRSFTSINKEEITLVYQWRNHPEIRKWMFNKAPISFNDHLSYISNLKKQKDNNYWLATKNNKPIGVVGLTRDKHFGLKWGFYLNPDLFGSSYAVDLIYNALFFFFNKIGIEELNGFVNCYNINSILIHHLFGIRHLSYASKTYEDQREWYSLRYISAEYWFRQNNNIKELKRKIIDNKRAIQNYRAAIMSELDYLEKHNFPPDFENSLLII